MEKTKKRIQQRQYGDKNLFSSQLKNITAVVLLFLLVITGFLLTGNLLKLMQITDAAHTASVKADAKVFQVYQNHKLIDTFASLDEAISFAKARDNCYIKEKGNPDQLWDHNASFILHDGTGGYWGFQTFAEAFEEGRTLDNAYIYSAKDFILVWDGLGLESESKIEGVPLILQKPELPRGCEVTSLCMLLNYKGIDVNKMRLAAEIKKDPTPLRIINGTKYYGNPHDGFVGDMYDLSKDGLGVYHKPIFELLDQYIPGSAIDLTGAGFDSIYYYINKKIPVFVITNATFDVLPDSRFETWKTPTGEIDITYQEHAVLITGYDQQYIYFNDPLSPYPRKAEKDKFIAAWEQMGRQAVTYAA